MVIPAPRPGAMSAESGLRLPPERPPSGPGRRAPVGGACGDPVGRPPRVLSSGAMRGSTIIALLLVAGCQKDGASTSPDDATPSGDAGTAGPTSDAGADGGAGGGADADPEEVETEATLEIDGGLTEAQVQKVIDAHFADIRACFDLALENPEGAQLLEPIIVKAEVEPSGKVGNTSVQESKFDDHPTEGCLVKLVGGWEFPAPKGKQPATLHIPFNLRSY